MNTLMYDSLQLRELFHIEFLRWLGRKVKAQSYAVKGGTNLRLFFKSFRYSEDMDLDVRDVSVSSLKDIVMDVLGSQNFLNTLKPFGIENIKPPDMAKAKQTQTTQRFKAHLITTHGEDLFTKVEFSRRGFDGGVVIQPVPDSILREYKLAPLLVSHYNARSAIMQKIKALATRSAIQARDVFDLYILSPQYEPAESKGIDVEDAKLTKAYENIFEISFEQFRDAVLSYLSKEDQAAHASSSSWDEIKLKAAHFIDELRGKNA